MVHPKSMIHLSAARRVTSIPLIHGFSTAAFVRPFGLDGRLSHSRAKSPGTLKGPPFSSPLKEALAFTVRHRALVRSMPTSPRRAVRSAWISSTTTPSSRGACSSRSSMREKQTSDTRTAAPSMTHGSSLHASKIRRASVAAFSARRFAPPRMELVATSPTRAALPDAICLPAFSNQ